MVAGDNAMSHPGQGCAAGVIGIELAQQLLKVCSMNKEHDIPHKGLVPYQVAQPGVTHLLRCPQLFKWLPQRFTCCKRVKLVSVQAAPNKVALLVVHENTTMGLSFSHEPATQFANLLYRSGGAATLLSNRYDFCCFAVELMVLCLQHTTIHKTWQHAYRQTLRCALAGQFATLQNPNPLCACH